MKKYLPRILAGLLFALMGCAPTPPQTEVVSGWISKVKLGSGYDGSRVMTRIVFMDRPDIVIEERQEGLKLHEGRKVKLVLEERLARDNFKSLSSFQVLD